MPLSRYQTFKHFPGNPTIGSSGGLAISYEAFRVSYQGFNDGTHRYKKLVTKTGSLSLIPSIGVLDICSGRRTEDRWLHLCRERI
jgi:hypothetical protein